MAGVWSLVGRCVRNRLFSSDVNELRCFNFSYLKNVAFYSAQNVSSRPRPRYFLIGLLSIGGGAIAGGIYSYYRLLELRPIPNDSQKTLPKIIQEIPYVEFSRTVTSPTDKTELDIILFQYPTCPFCCKVRAFLDYYGLSYNVVEVNPVFRQQIKWSDYRKVPIVLVRVFGGYQQLNDSTMIISAVGSLLRDKLTNIAEVVKCYPTIEYHGEDGYRKKEIMNRYFLMYKDNSREVNSDEIKRERKWRKWADEELVHMLSPNVYRTTDEALQAFRWFSQVGDWEKVFSPLEASFIVNIGAYAMWIIGKRLKKRHGLKDDVRQSLYDSCNLWLRELSKTGTPYHGGSAPNLADLAVYGILSSIEGCDAFKDLLANTKIGPWYYRMKNSCSKHEGANFI